MNEWCVASKKLGGNCTEKNILENLLAGWKACFTKEENGMIGHTWIWLGQPIFNVESRTTRFMCDSNIPFFPHTSKFPSISSPCIQINPLFTSILTQKETSGRVNSKHRVILLFLRVKTRDILERTTNPKISTELRGRQTMQMGQQ